MAAAERSTITMPLADQQKKASEPPLPSLNLPISTVPGEFSHVSLSTQSYSLIG